MKILLKEFISKTLEEQMILIPHPPSPEQQVLELEEISRQRQMPITPSEYMEELDDMTWLFNRAILRSGGQESLDLIESMIDKVVPIITFHKEYFNVGRPWQLADKLGIDFDYDYVESAQTPSYPSGHATQAFYIAHKLSEIHPDQKDIFHAIAQMISESRIDFGVHFPSDILAGKILAAKLIELDL